MFELKKGIFLERYGDDLVLSWHGRENPVWAAGSSASEVLASQAILGIAAEKGSAFMWCGAEPKDLVWTLKTLSPGKQSQLIVELNEEGTDTVRVVLGRMRLVEFLLWLTRGIKPFSVELKGCLFSPTENGGIRVGIRTKEGVEFQTWDYGTVCTLRRALELAMDMTGMNGNEAFRFTIPDAVRLRGEMKADGIKVFYLAIGDEKTLQLSVTEVVRLLLLMYVM